MNDDVKITWHKQQVSRKDRESQSGQRGCVVWFTGLSGSGKSTVANQVERTLFSLGARSYLLDGDNIRHGLCASPAILAKAYDQPVADRFGLGFAEADRQENIRRVGTVAQLFCDAGLITLAAFVSPYRADRDAIRANLQEGDFVEVWVDAPLDVCESRDPKGLYELARAGKIKDFTGIDAPYEAPVQAELHLAAGKASPEELAEQVVDFLRKVGIIGTSQPS